MIKFSIFKVIEWAKNYTSYTGYIWMDYKGLLIMENMEALLFI